MCHITSHTANDLRQVRHPDEARGCRLGRSADLRLTVWVGGAMVLTPGMTVVIHMGYTTAVK